MDAAKLVKVYIKMRDAKAAKEAEMKAISEQMSLIEQELLEVCKSTGQDGGKTEFGSFTRSVKSRYWTNDWDSFYKVIREHDVPQLLEQRIHQGNFKEFITANPEHMPAGVNVESKYSITVYRPR